jgi:hypothetical protein
MKKISSILICALVSVGTVTAFNVNPIVAPTPVANAATSTLYKNFDPASIISDSKFYTSNAMSIAEIQNFLNYQGSSCKSSGNNKCLKDYKETTPNKSESKGTDDETGAGYVRCKAYTGGANKSAADIISTVSKLCNISEKALLVITQKEQSLVTRTDPTYVDPNGKHENDGWAYRASFGFGCPDNGACSKDYYGFFNQLYAAAKQFQIYKHTTSFNFYKGRTSSIGYHPNSNIKKPTCGKKKVKIANHATAGLYNYTPYVPNSAALDAGTGIGDKCSSYGNRNFYYYYNRWFGFSGDTPTDLKFFTASGLQAKAFNNKAITQPVSLVFSNVKVPNSSVTVTYVNNKFVGTASIIIDATESQTFVGRKIATFSITPNINGFGVDSLKSGKRNAKTLSVNIKKLSSSKMNSMGGVSKIKLYYSKDKKKWKTKVLSKDTNIYKLKKLTQGKKYFVKFRVYKTVNGKDYYSPYTKTWKTAKVK